MKVLIISHNPISTQNNMGKTLLRLFAAFDREELCQLYIYPTIPDCRRCASYYRITDQEVLSGLLRGKRAGGELDCSLISREQGLYQHPEDEAVYRNPKNKAPYRRLLRDAMWRMVNWYNRDLCQWLDRERPECIFLAPGAGAFLYDFALTIARRRQIPIVTYLCDEYYFLKQPVDPLDRLRLGKLRGKIWQLMDTTSHLVVISPEMAQAYAQKFKVDTTVLMTGTGIALASEPMLAKKPNTLCYFGNIRCGRHWSLAQIGRALWEINREDGTSYRLKVYTFEKDTTILETLRPIPSITLCPAVTGEAYEKALREADRLLHVEGFGETSVDAVRHSISTKIPDCLASGIPLVAYGPKQVSSMAHLLRNGCAIAATEKEELKPMLRAAFRDPVLAENAAARALITARECHHPQRCAMTLKTILTQVLERERKQL